MKRYYLLIVVLLGVNLICQSQQVTYNWSGAWGNEKNSYSRHVFTDAKGNIYLTGQFSDSLDFDPSFNTYFENASLVNSSGNYVLKLDINGNFIWISPIQSHGSYVSSIHDLIVDSIGNIYITGAYKGSQDFDPGLSSWLLNSSSTDCFVWKLDKNGSFEWVKTFGGISSDVAQHVVLKENGNLLVTGRYIGQVDFNPDSLATNYLNAGIEESSFFLTLDDQGNYVSCLDFRPYVNDMKVKKNGNIYICGHYKGTMDFDPSNSNVFHTSLNNWNDIYFSKFDKSLQLKWVKVLPNMGTQGPLEMGLDSLDNIFFNGQFSDHSDSVDMQPGSGVYKLDRKAGVNTDFFIVKYDSTGSLLWGHSIGSVGNEYVSGLATSEAGEVYSIGTFKQSLDFNPGSATHVVGNYKKYGTFVLKLNALGNFSWVKTFMGRPLFQGGNDVALGPARSVFATGWFKDSLDGNPSNLIANMHYGYTNKNSIYLIALNQCGSGVTLDVVNACNSFTWVDGMTYDTSNYDASYTLQNIVGCDSVVNLNLTMSYVDTSVTKSNMILTSHAVGVKYQWMRCDLNYSQLVGDTSQFLHVTMPGYYSVEVNDNGCIDTSRCFAMGGVGINEVERETVLVYPNPSRGGFVIELSDNFRRTELRVYSVTGKLTFFKELKGGENHLDLKVPSGIYSFQFQSNSGIITRRVIINN